MTDTETKDRPAEATKNKPIVTLVFEESPDRQRAWATALGGSVIIQPPSNEPSLLLLEGVRTELPSEDWE